MATEEQGYKIPEAFLEAFGSTFGQQEAEAFCRFVNQPSPVSIRVNPYKLNTPPIGGKIVPWCSLGYYLDTRPTFGIDPLWHAGAYYVQEASSMFVSQYLSELSDDTKIVLDLCAAPGGKSTLLRSLLPKTCVLIANEPDRGRVSALHENLTRFGSDEVIVTNAYPNELRKSGLMCDMILVDAPCSGEGMFRKDPNSRNEWSMGSVASCSIKQKEILDEAWRMLHQGGILIYSTCTYNKEENEAQLEDLLEHYDVAKIIFPDLKTPEAMGISKGERDGVYRFFPHHTVGEGFTIFALQKAGKKQKVSQEQRNRKRETQNSQIPSILKDSIREQVNITNEGDEFVYLSPQGKVIADLLIKARVRVLSKGITLGSVKGKDFVPHHSWAMSNMIADQAPYPHIEVDEDTALAYLKRDTINLAPHKGFECITYKGVPLGWVKNIGNRVNNLYPKELVIRNRNAVSEELPKLF